MLWQGKRYPRQWAKKNSLNYCKRETSFQWLSSSRSDYSRTKWLHVYICMQNSWNHKKIRFDLQENKIDHHRRGYYMKKIVINAATGMDQAELSSEIQNLITHDIEKKDSHLYLVMFKNDINMNNITLKQWHGKTNCYSTKRCLQCAEQKNICVVKKGILYRNVVTVEEHV